MFVFCRCLKSLRLSFGSKPHHAVYRRSPQFQVLANGKLLVFVLDIPVAGSIFPACQNFPRWVAGSYFYVHSVYIYYMFVTYWWWHCFDYVFSSCINLGCSFDDLSTASDQRTLPRLLSQLGLPFSTTLLSAYRSKSGWLQSCDVRNSPETELLRSMHSSAPSCVLFMCSGGTSERRGFL